MSNEEVLNNNMSNEAFNDKVEKDNIVGSLVQRGKEVIREGTLEEWKSLISRSIDNTFACQELYHSIALMELIEKDHKDFKEAKEYYNQVKETSASFISIVLKYSKYGIEFVNSACDEKTKKNQIVHDMIKYVSDKYVGK